MTSPLTGGEDLQQHSEFEFSHFFALSLDLLAIAGFDGYFKLLNRSWVRTLGYPLEELYAKPFIEFVHPEDRERTRREAEALSLGAQTVTFKNRYRCRDGTYRHMEWTAAPSTERSRIYAIARDVTEHERFEEELARGKEAAEAASKAKSLFLAMMSHELRTPLNSVIGFSDLLLRQGQLQTVERDYAERILRNGRGLLQLIDSILDLSSIEAGRTELSPEAVDLVALARETAAGLPIPPAGGAVELRLDLPSGPVPRTTDPQRLGQILTNLLVNGLKFTERGSVTLHLGTGPGGSAVFEVRDTGPGIPPEGLEEVFEPFHQLDQSRARRAGGSGLGLAVARLLADNLGYPLEVESEVGRGTTFRLTLPDDAPAA